jgi:hypothetical protein
MRLGVHLPVAGKGASPGIILQLAVEAERTGLDSAWSWERLMRPTVPTALGGAGGPVMDAPRRLALCMTRSMVKLSGSSADPGRIWAREMAAASACSELQLPTIFTCRSHRHLTGGVSLLHPRQPGRYATSIGAAGQPPERSPLLVKSPYGGPPTASTPATNRSSIAADSFRPLATTPRLKSRPRQRNSDHHIQKPRLLKPRVIGRQRLPQPPALHPRSPPRVGL